MNIQQIELDLSKSPEPLQTVYIAVGDYYSPYLDVKVLDHGEPANLTGTTSTIEIRKDDKYVSQSNTRRDGSVLRFMFSRYMRNPVSGAYDVELGAGETDIAYVQIKKGDMKVSTARFHLVILEKAEQV